MTPLEILLYAVASGFALILVSILGGIAYMIWTTAVQVANKKNGK